MSTPPSPTAPPPDANDPLHVAFQAWESRRASVVSIALLGAEAWREESTPLAGRLDRRCEATSSFYEEAVAALRLLDAAPRTRLRSAETP